MDQDLRWARQPHIAVGTGLLALVALGAVWFAQPLPPLRAIGALGVLLVAGVILAYQFPMYVGHNTKICVTSIPLYLLAVLLSPGPAVAAAGLSVVLGEFLVRTHRGTTAADISTSAARWMLVALAGALAAHAAPGNSLLVHVPALVAAAAVLWAGDLITLPLVLAPINGDPPGKILRAAFQEGWLTEAIQYVLAMLGALAAGYQVGALGLLAIPAVLVYLVFKKEMDDETIQLLESMADTVDLRDPYTGGHSRRVAELTDGLLRELGMHGQEAALIRTASRIHDLGKIGVPDEVLIKPAPLTNEEEGLVKSYPGQGAELLTRYPDFSRGIAMVLHHHERWDGMGYPSGLSGTDIPFGARLIAVVDSYDAMTSDRPYRRALSPERAAHILHDGRGRQWDPAIVDAFLRSIGQQGESLPPDSCNEPATTEQPLTA